MSLQQPKPAPSARLSRRLVFTMAVAAGVAVANLYYVQPLLHEIQVDFRAASWQVGLAATMTQIGYALGLFLFVPLGDSLERRSLIVRMCLATAAGLVLLAGSPNLVWLTALCLVVGAATIVPQLVVPYAAHLAPAEERGRTVGTVMSGLLIGVLLARTFAGLVGQGLGWRAMYAIAAACMVALAAVLRLSLPASPPETRTPYGQLLWSLVHLIRRYPDLRDASLLGGMSFAAFSSFWTVLSLYLAGPPFHLGPGATGLFGLAGVAGALAAPYAGHLASRLPAVWTARLAACVTLASFGLLFAFRHSLAGLALGVVLMDLGVQGTQVSNQARIYSLSDEARSRVNSIYMVAYFLGGALGSLIGASVWDQFRFGGVCAAACILLAIGICGIVAVAPSRLTAKRR
ncbi:MFS transporter [Alicyclobacillus vulcanalis]|uniref:Predicted arabinose efflux permease, MFS family n=1 Tax=Alicyclobacillus vulcanalis TaxID=252246 RepID=A0A1N7PMU5_9BACL|nr:MFS transporter [Alicyclobacillus vulcanalis]SIT11881.1 Predicted arabinose efflux permease, MFS family [Alicyclobacillus vulcanalis]